MRGLKAKKNIIFSLFQQFVTIICGFIAPRIIISVYGSEINGMISSITQFLAYITFLEVGFGPVAKSLLYKAIAKKDHEEISNILSCTQSFFRKLAFVFILYIIILCIILPDLYIKNYNIMFTVSLIIIISLSSFFEYFFGITYSLYLQAEQELRVVSLIKSICKILNTLLIIFLALNKYSIQVVKLSSSLIFIISPIFLSFYVKRKYKISICKKSDYKIKEKFAGLSQHIAAIIHGNTDVTLLTFLSNSLEVSVYSVYMLIINSIRDLINSFIDGVAAGFGDMIARKENDSLNKNYNKFENYYYSIITIVFACTASLIVSFIKIYTNGINDVNYIRPCFSVIMTFAEFVYVARLPYNSLALSAGHFKQTVKGAWIEVIINIILSVVLINKLGMVGLAIGTLISMTYRTLDFIFYTSKEILNRVVTIGINKFILSMIEFWIIYIVCQKCVNYNVSTFFQWGILAVKDLLLAVLITLCINYVIYRKCNYNKSTIHRPSKK